MDIRQLEFFVAVAEELNFTRAADMTHVTQSGLSSSIRGLERELHTQLFERTSRAVALTPSGHAFLPRARRILRDAQEAQRELARSAEDIIGTLAIGAEQCLGDLVDLPDLFASFQERYPGVSIRFEQLGSQTLLDKLHRKELDVALVAQAGHVTPAYGDLVDSFEVSRNGFELIMTPTHPLAARKGPTWSDFEEHAFVDFDTTWTARRILDTAFTERRLVRRSAYSINDVHMLIDLVHKGLGVALIPAPLANKPHADGLIRRQLDEPDLTWAVRFVRRDGANAPARLFAEMIFTTHMLAAAQTGIHESTPGPPRTASEMEHLP